MSSRDNRAPCERSHVWFWQWSNDALLDIGRLSSHESPIDTNKPRLSMLQMFAVLQGLLCYFRSCRAEFGDRPATVGGRSCEIEAHGEYKGTLAHGSAVCTESTVHESDMHHHSYWHGVRVVNTLDRVLMPVQRYGVCWRRCRHGSSKVLVIAGFW